VTTPDHPSVHPAWLPDAATAFLRGRTVRVVGGGPLAATVRAEVRRARAVPVDEERADLVLRDTGAVPGGEGFVVAHRDGGLEVAAADDAGLVHAWFHVVRAGAAALDGTAAVTAVRHEPAHALRMLDHWDNVDVHRCRPARRPRPRGRRARGPTRVDGRVDLALTLARHEVTLVEIDPVRDETPAWLDDARILGRGT